MFSPVLVPALALCFASDFCSSLFPKSFCAASLSSPVVSALLPFALLSPLVVLPALGPCSRTFLLSFHPWIHGSDSQGRFRGARSCLALRKRILSFYPKDFSLSSFLPVCPENSPRAVRGQKLGMHFVLHIHENLWDFKAEIDGSAQLQVSVDTRCLAGVSSFLVWHLWVLLN